jgi:hypothetical protein
MANERQAGPCDRKSAKIPILHALPDALCPDCSGDGYIAGLDGFTEVECPECAYRAKEVRYGV